MLNISPFSFGLIIQQVYDNGSVYSPDVLDITEASLHARFLEVRGRLVSTQVFYGRNSVQCKILFLYRV